VVAYFFVRVLQASTSTPVRKPARAEARHLAA